METDPLCNGIWQTWICRYLAINMRLGFANITLCRSEHFMQFLGNIIWNWTPPTLPWGGEFANTAFLCRSGILLNSIQNKLGEITPHSHPMRMGFDNHDLIMILIFHTIWRKKFYSLNIKPIKLYACQPLPDQSAVLSKQTASTNILLWTALC